MNDLTRTVYSCEHGRICPECGQSADRCTCAGGKAQAAGDGVVRVRRESKGRGGKTVTVITGVPLADAELKVLVKELKRRCGTGGALKDGTIEIQGDHAELLVTELQRRGYTVKRAGG